MEKHALESRQESGVADVRDRRAAALMATLLVAGAAGAATHGDVELAEVCAVLAVLLLVMALSIRAAPALGDWWSRRRSGGAGTSAGEAAGRPG
jgi:hypothetical protein